MGRKSIPILLKATSPEGETKTFTSIGKAAKESRAQHGLSPSGNLINMHKIGKIACVGFNSQLLANT